MTSLRPLLRINAASCLGFGVLFLAAPGAVARTLGAAPEALPAVLGVGLVLNGAHLPLAAQRARPVAAEIVRFSLGDLTWWLGTMALIGAGVWITTPAGTAAALLVAAGVAALGVKQLSALGALRAARGGGASGGPGRPCRGRYGCG